MIKPKKYGRDFQVPDLSLLHHSFIVRCLKPSRPGHKIGGNRLSVLENIMPIAGSAHCPVLSGGASTYTNSGHRLGSPYGQPACCVVACYWHPLACPCPLSTDHTGRGLWLNRWRVSLP